MKKNNSNINPWLEVTARIGFAVKGILYLIMDALALQIVLGIGGETAGLKDVIKEIIKQAGPFGKILLGIVAIGLISHCFWRLMQSVFNVDQKEINFQNIIDRIGFFTSVLAYGGLVYFSIKLIFGLGGSSTSPQQLTEAVIFKPLGRTLIGLVGLGIGGSGLYQIYFGISGKFQKKFNVSEMNNFERIFSKYISMIGLILRGIVFIILGIFLIEAAIQYDPHKAGGMDKVLNKILEQPLGIWLLTITALGLAAYGGYCIILSRYRKFPLGNS